MERRSYSFDYITLGLFLFLSLMGWLTIYAVSSIGGTDGAIDFNSSHGRQLVWMLFSLFLLLIVIFIDHRFFETLAYIIYGLGIVLLIVTIFVGKKVSGATSWLIIGGQSLQPSELAKVGTALALAKFISSTGFTVKSTDKVLRAIGIILLPALVVILQNDTGSALVFGSMLLVLYREGVSPLVPLFFIILLVVALMSLGFSNWWLVYLFILVISALSFFVLYNRRNLRKILLFHLAALVFFSAFAFSTKLIVSKMPVHQQNRIMVLFDAKLDPLGIGYNVIQSKIAIGSGGWVGKGYLKGNYTKYRFVPKQETDFIFCTVGEEQGWLGSAFIVGLFGVFLWRIYFVSENGKTSFTRVYGYCVFAIFLFHTLINMGMTVGFVPVIGIPLPMFSYGGSAILGFTLMIAILINLYSNRKAVLGNK